MNNMTQDDFSHDVVKKSFCGIKSGNDRSILATGTYGRSGARMLGQRARLSAMTGGQSTWKVGAVDMSCTCPVDNQLVSQPGKRGGGVPPALTRYSLSRLGQVVRVALRGAHHQQVGPGPSVH